MRIATFALSAALLAAASVSNAAVTAINLVPVTQDQVADHQTFDIMVTGTGQMTGVQMLLNTDAGGIYQDEVGGDTAPNGSFFPLAPTVEFDTFVSMGGPTTATSLAPIIPGGAVNLGGASGLTFSDSTLDVTWAPPGASPVNDPTDYMVGRLTLANTTTGSLLLLGSTFMEADFLNPEINLATLLGDDVEGPLAQANPDGGSSISLQGAFSDGTGFMDNAIVFTNGRPGSDPELEITGVAFNSNDEDLFTATIDGLNIDLGLDVAKALDGPKRDVAAELVVSTNDPQNPTFTYNLTARVPEPSTFALAGLALVDLVGFARRK